MLSYPIFAPLNGLVYHNLLIGIMTCTKEVF